MIASMTGFARAEASAPTGTLVCELRSVNHRFLEASLRLPDELRSLDPELRARLQKELRRGKVDCTFTYRTADPAGRPLELDGALLERLQPLLERLGETARDSGIPGWSLRVDGAARAGMTRDATAPLVPTTDACP